VSISLLMVSPFQVRILVTFYCRKRQRNQWFQKPNKQSTSQWHFLAFTASLKEGYTYKKFCGADLGSENLFSVWLLSHNKLHSLFPTEHNVILFNFTVTKYRPHSQHQIWSPVSKTPRMNGESIKMALISPVCLR
jgi:hypothetical protein